MSRYFTLPLAVLFIAALSLGAVAQELSDPYEILNRSFEASGGLDRLRAENSSYMEGTIALAGMTGTVKVWIERPGRSRAEVVLGPLNIIQGDNGEYPWALDSNGKLQKTTNQDEATIKRRRISLLMDDYAYAEAQSDVFAVALQGTEKVDARDCYVVKVTNSINVDSYTAWVNTATFRLEKAVFIEDQESRDVFYGDYREVDGLMVPFRTREIAHQTGQGPETVVTRYVSNPKIDPGLFEPPEEGGRDYEFTEGNSAENIPFRFIEGHLFIPVYVNGRERVWVIDTGAGMTVLNRAFAEELGLELEGDLKGRGAGGTVNASFATLPPYAVDGIDFQGQLVAVIDMDELIRRVGLDVVGILGFDFLSRFVTRVDYANERISFYDPESFEYSGDGQVLDVHFENSLFEAEATLDGTHSGIWLFDLGAGSTHLDGAYALSEGFAARSGVITMGHGAGNAYQLKTIKSDSLLFAGFTVYDPPISFSYGGTDTTFTADQIGTLGNTLFRNFVLYCDYARERVIVEKGAKFNQLWPEDHSGLGLAWDADGGVEVVYVSPETPAEKAGFLAGDRLTSINGIDVDWFDGIVAIRKALRADPGTKYECLVDRGGVEKKLKLNLARLL